MGSAYAEDDRDSPEEQPARSPRGKVPFIALLIGLVVGIVLMLSLGGNPLSSANEVRYQDVIVGSVSENQDQICWSTDSADRDATRTCAILALDPQSTPPTEGEQVTIGVVDIAAPGGQSQRQVVFTAPVDGDTATEAGTE